MKNYIYIKNDGIQVVTVNGKSKEAKEYSLENGAILNGVIIRSEPIKNILSEISSTLNNVTLVVDSSNIITKKIVIPNISSDKLSEVVKGEFDLYSKEDSYIFDANVIKQTKKEMTVLCFAISKDFLQSYKNIFAELKVKIKRIDVAINGVIKHVCNTNSYKRETFVINVVSGQNMLSLLFENGEYKFVNRSRLLNKDLPDAFNQELYARLSSLVQFIQSEKSEFTIEKSYYVGLDEMQVEAFARYVAEINGEIEVENFTATDFDADFIFPCSAMIVNKHDIDFSKDKAEKKSALKKSKSLLIKLAVVLVVFVVLAVNIGTMLFDKIGLEKDNKDISGFLNSEEVVAQLAHYDTLVTEHSSVQNAKKVFEKIANMEEISGLVRTETLNTIFSQDISGLNFSLSSGTISLSGVMIGEQALVDFVKLLRADESFADLSYSGYSIIGESDVENEAIDANDQYVYSFNISASLQLVESEATND